MATTGRKLTDSDRYTQDEFIAEWAALAGWPAVEWDYTEWEECLLSFEAYEKKLDIIE